MKLKNVLIVVDDMEESIRFYHEMFGLQVIKTPVVRNGKQSTLGYQPDVWKGWN